MLLPMLLQEDMGCVLWAVTMVIRGLSAVYRLFISMLFFVGKEVKDGNISKGLLK